MKFDIHEIKACWDNGRQDCWILDTSRMQQLTNLTQVRSKAGKWCRGSRLGYFYPLEKLYWGLDTNWEHTWSIILVIY